MKNKDITEQLESLLETLAAVEHGRWAHWQKYLHGKCEQHANGALVIPDDLVKKCEQQITTPYAELSEKEKESDREQVRIYLAIISQALS